MKNVKNGKGNFVNKPQNISIAYFFLFFSVQNCYMYDRRLRLDFQFLYDEETVQTSTVHYFGVMLFWNFADVTCTYVSEVKQPDLREQTTLQGFSQLQHSGNDNSKHHEDLQNVISDTYIVTIKCSLLLPNKATSSYWFFIIIKIYLG